MRLLGYRAPEIFGRRDAVYAAKQDRALRQARPGATDLFCNTVKGSPVESRLQTKCRRDLYRRGVFIWSGANPIQDALNQIEHPPLFVCPYIGISFLAVDVPIHLRKIKINVLF
jgi:hypothetical protein